MPPDRCRPYSPAEVHAAVSTLRVGCHGDERWSDRIRLNVDGILGILDAILSSPREPTNEELEGIKGRLRKASSFSQGHLRPLFVSSGFVKRHSKRLEDRQWAARLGPDDLGEIYEHVVPLRHTLHAAAFASDPAAALASPAAHYVKRGVPAFLNPLARNLLALTCYVSRHEDRRIHRLDHPDWTRPFARYLAPEVSRDAPEDPIEIYDAWTGEPLADAAGYTWERYAEALRRAEGYSDGLTWVEGLAGYLAARQGATLGLIAGWRARAATQPRASVACYTAAERAELRALFDALMARPDAPRTLCGKPALDIPANGKRLTLSVLAPDQDCPKAERLAFRVLVGGNHGTRKLYWNDSEMRPEGQEWIRQVAERAVLLNPMGELMPYTQDSAVPRNGWALRIPLPRDTERSAAERMADALTVVVGAIIELYPAWRAVCAPAGPAP